jgi:hypothetical protein
MRYAAEYKTSAELLAAFVRRKGGINKCAGRFTRCLGGGNDRVFLSISPSVPRSFQVGYLGIGHAAWLVLVLLRILLAFRNEAVLSGALERLAV